MSIGNAPGCGYPVAPGRGGFAIFFLVILILLLFPGFLGGGLY